MQISQDKIKRKSIFRMKKPGSKKDGIRKGKQKFSDGSKYVGGWKDGGYYGQGTFTYANGDEYVGEWKDGVQNGKGTHTHANGDKYIGEWKDGERHGRGTATHGSGYVYLGEWKKNKRHGQGRSFSNGNVYLGQWKADKKHGQGTHTTPSGDEYVGGWKDDKRNGHGTVISKNGEKFVGEWKNDDKHGFGALFCADGSLLFSGQWHQGSYLNKVKNSNPSKSPKRSKPREKNNWFNKNWVVKKLVLSPEDRVVPKVENLKRQGFLRSKHYFWTLRRLIGITLAVIIIPPVIILIVITTIIFSQVNDQQLHAAITQPQMLIQQAGGRIEVIECNCERTLKHSEIPEDFKVALKYREDRRFDTHYGVDPLSLLSALRQLGRRGGSTLEMQLVKNTIVQTNRNLWRKLNEAVFAIRLNFVFEKEDILRLYLSKVNFGRINGRNIVGLRAAAQAYFNKEPDRINLPETAFLLALISNPSRFNPLRDPELALSKSDKIARGLYLNKGVQYGGKSELRKYLPTKPGKLPKRHRFVEDYVRQEFMQLGLQDGKYLVVTTIDPVAQMQAERSVVKAMNEYKRKNSRSGVERAALISIDKSGGIKAMLGGLNYQKSQFNLATSAERQPASTAKIVTYLAALEKGLGQFTSVYDDQSKLKMYKPRNADKRYKGKIPAHQCFSESRNVCTYYLAETLVGFEAVSTMWTKLGLSVDTPPGRDIVLGTAETTLLKNAAAFGAVKNSGVYREPYSIRFVIAPYGRIEPSSKISERTVFNENIAFKMQNLLEKVVGPNGTANGALIPGHKTFGKTGTSQKNRDAWFVGFTEHRVTTGVWVGPGENTTMNGVSGGSLPAQIFKRYNQNLYERFEKCGGEFNLFNEGFARDINC